MEGRFLQAVDVPALQEAARNAHFEGAGAVLLADGPLGDAVTLAGLLAATVQRDAPDLWVGICADLSASSVAHRRHPTVLARDLTALDHLNGGRTILALTGPLGDIAVLEAAEICLAMWRYGTAQSGGATYPVPGAVNLPVPPSPGSPVIALDLTGPGPGTPPGELRQLASYVLRPVPDGRADACTLDPAT